MAGVLCFTIPIYSLRKEARMKFGITVQFFFFKSKIFNSYNLLFFREMIGVIVKMFWQHFVVIVAHRFNYQLKLNIKGSTQVNPY